MQLNKNYWEDKDFKLFQNYIVTLKNDAKIEFQKKIIKTNYKVLGILSPKIKEIARNIAKGNYYSFLDKNLCDYYENFAINLELINYISNFDDFKHYLLSFSKSIDNWANCDQIKFKINTKNEENYLKLSKYLMKSNLPFERRIGVDILFRFINDKYLNEVFTVLNSFKNETNYYVNMALAWLFCECFIKYPKKTYNFLKTHSMNDFVINKGISKCRDSFRVSNEDKMKLLDYKV